MGFIKKRTCYFSLILALFAAQTGAAQNNADSTKADSILMKQLEAQMNATNATQPAPQPARSTATANPDIGVIGDFQGSYISTGKKNFDAYLNETEVSLQAAVDPYARADFFVSVGRDENGKYGVSIEEG